jgi:hypothetical protein
MSGGASAVMEVAATEQFHAGTQPAHAFPVALALSHYTIAMLLIDACEGASDHWLARVDVDLTHDAPVHSQAERKAIIGPDPRAEAFAFWRDFTWPLFAVAPLVDGCSLVLHVYNPAGAPADQPQAVYRVGRQEIARAVQTLAEKHPQRFAEIIGGTWDGDDSDVFLQLCAFGKVIYG